jgi:hypothetical protein
MKNFLAPVMIALAAIFTEQVWWVRGLIGAGIGAALFIAIPAAIEWATQRSNITNLRVDCLLDVLPMRLPAQVRIVIAQLLSSPDIPSHQVGQIQEKFGEPGAATGFPARSYAHRCEVRTVGQQRPIFDLRLFLKVEFQSLVPNLDGRSAGAGQTTRSGNLVINVPRAEDSAPFVFWISNESTQIARVIDVSAVAAGSNENKPTLVVNHNFSAIEMTLPPRLPM